MAVKEVRRGEWEDGLIDEANKDGHALGQSTICTMAGEELLQEAAILSTLSHPNTVHMYGVAVEWENEKISCYFFVTELCKVDHCVAWRFFSCWHFLHADLSR